MFNVPYYIAQFGARYVTHTHKHTSIYLSIYNNFMYFQCVNYYILKNHVELGDVVWLHKIFFSMFCIILQQKHVNTQKAMAQKLVWMNC